MTKLFHNWDFWGWVGSIVAVTSPVLKMLTPPLQFLGACGGLVLLFYSIRHKHLEIKKLKGKKK